jgi:hypothetical protein
MAEPSVEIAVGLEPAVVRPVTAGRRAKDVCNPPLWLYLSVSVWIRLDLLVCISGFCIRTACTFHCRHLSVAPTPFL